MSLWWAICLAALVAIACYAFRREWPVTSARRVLLTSLLGLGMIGPLLIALNPTWVESVPPLPGNPMLTVLIDGTLSMRTEDVGGLRGTTRWTRAMEIAGLVKQESSSIEVRKMVFGDLVTPLSELQKSASTNVDAVGRRTDLGAALKQTSRTGSPLGHAILMISDGAHNVGAVESALQSAKEANALATPIYTVTLGTSVGMKNLLVTAKSSRMIAFPKNPVAIRASVMHSGLAGQSTQVQLMKGEQVLQSKTMRLTAEPSQEVRFTIEDGVNEPIERFRIVASDVPDEVTTADNQTTVLVQRLSAPIGVLVLEGKPYWDSKFLARNLARDPVVDLTTIVRLGDGRFLQRRVTREALAESDVEKKGLDKTPSATEASAVTANATTDRVPLDTATDDWAVQKELESPLESMELLGKYRLVILGRDAGAYLTDRGIENLRTWISTNGGCLLCSRGAPTDQVSSKLAEILPVRWSPTSESRFRAKVTQQGIDSAVFDPLLAEGSDPLGSLPSLAMDQMPKQRAGLPQVLMQSAVDDSGVSIPMVTYQPFGGGQTIVVEGAGMWRWAFLSPQHAAKDKIYPTLWQSMIQWIISQNDMMPGQELAIRPDRATFLTGDRASASISLREPGKWNTSGGLNGLSVLMQATGADEQTRLSIVPSGVDSNLFRVDMGTVGVGFYTLKVLAGENEEVMAATAFEVRDPWFETLEVDARPDVMSQIARLSGGEVLTPEQVSELVRRFEERIKQQQKYKETRTTIWDRPFVLLLILVGWVSTWIVRRQNGLV